MLSCYHIIKGGCFGFWPKLYGLGTILSQRFSPTYPLLPESPPPPLLALSMDMAALFSIMNEINPLLFRSIAVFLALI